MKTKKKRVSSESGIVNIPHFTKVYRELGVAGVESLKKHCGWFEETFRVMESSDAGPMWVATSSGVIFRYEREGEEPRPILSWRGVPEGSPEWDILYGKYFEEEMQRHGG